MWGLPLAAGEPQRIEAVSLGKDHRHLNSRTLGNRKPCLISSDPEEEGAGPWSHRANMISSLLAQHQHSHTTSHPNMMG